MAEPLPSFFARLALAILSFFRILANGQLALYVRRFSTPVLPAATEPAAPAAPRTGPAPVVLRSASPDGALQLLAILQREGRFVDFLEEDVASFSDAEIGAAARVVHDGCRRALREHLTLSPIRTETEGARITLPEGFDASAVRLTGNVVGKAPFTGALQHRGWRATDVRLPKLAERHDATVVAPAEVELS